MLGNLAGDLLNRQIVEVVVFNDPLPVSVVESQILLLGCHGLILEARLIRIELRSGVDGHRHYFRAFRYSGLVVPNGFGFAEGASSAEHRPAAMKAKSQRNSQIF